MSVKSFDSLAEDAGRKWSQLAREVYDASSTAFSAERVEREMLGAQLAAARKEHELSQQALAELTGVQQAEISRIERGVSNPTVDTISKIVRALGLRLMIEPVG